MANRKDTPPGVLGTWCGYGSTRTAGRSSTNGRARVWARRPPATAATATASRRAARERTAVMASGRSARDDGRGREQEQSAAGRRQRQVRLLRRRRRFLRPRGQVLGLELALVRL